MPEVTETVELGADAERLWCEIGGFVSVGDWHPLIERLEITRTAGLMRMARGRDGNEQLERLTELDSVGHSYDYSMERSYLPVRDYAGTFRIEPAGEEASRVTWSVRFDLVNGGGADTVESVRQFLHAGTESLRARYPTR